MLRNCVGRIRYLGVLLYDADRIEERQAPSAKLTSMSASAKCFSSTRSLSDRGSPETRYSTKRDEAAQRSPVYKMAMDWKLALRCTLNIAPCRWSGTFLRCRRSVLRRCGRFAEKRRRAARHRSLRIPVQYLANMLSAGDTGRYCGR